MRSEKEKDSTGARDESREGRCQARSSAAKFLDLQDKMVGGVYGTRTRGLRRDRQQRGCGTRWQDFATLWSELDFSRP